MKTTLPDRFVNGTSITHLLGHMLTGCSAAFAPFDSDDLELNAPNLSDNRIVVAQPASDVFVRLQKLHNWAGREKIHALATAVALLIEIKVLQEYEVEHTRQIPDDNAVCYEVCMMDNQPTLVAMIVPVVEVD